MTRSGAAVAIVALLLARPSVATADVALDWNEVAITTLISQPPPGVSPFAQARFMAIIQLAVFEAVNAITGDYDPYLGTVVAPPGASADAAAATAAYKVLKNYFAGAANLDPAYQASLDAIPDGPAKEDGITIGEAAALQMITLRANDGSSPAEFYPPQPAAPGVWQATPSCPAGGGTNFHWKKVTPFGIPSDPMDPEAWIEPFRPDPPPALTSLHYARDYNEVKTVGSVNSTPDQRPPDRADVARFFQASSPSFAFNLAARQVSAAQGRSLSHNARALALINMATNDALVASFGAKYFYDFWRPETAIHAGDTDDNPRTDPENPWAPYITTPCFPSYPSNHASGSSGAGEMLRRLYGADGHDITLENPAVPGVVLEYTAFRQITDDVDDARVYG